VPAFHIACSGLAADNSTEATAEKLQQFAGNIHIPV
jgi:hypothetical protein